MASNINPNNINGAYPVAGQDNDSQGFRDNFTNTRLNFTAAANELTDLQAKVILSAPLVGTVSPPVPWVNNLSGSALSNGLLRNMRSTVSGVQTGTTATIDFSQNSYWRVKPAGTCVISFANIPIAGQFAQIRLDIDTSDANFDITANTVTFTGTVSPSGEIQGLDGNVLTFNQVGTFSYEIDFIQGAGNLRLQDLSRNRDPMYLPSAQLLSANGNVNLAVTTTVITSSGNIVGNLSAGLEGQIKILVYGNSTSGNTRITVEDAAWSGSSLANLSAVGSAATFQYINDKWVCIGNNGVSFS